MKDNFIGLVKKGKTLNGSMISLARLQLMAGLAALGHDGATFTDLKLALDLTDGALYTHLKTLQESGYVQAQTVTVEGKDAQAYRMTDEGTSEWNRIRNWLLELTQYGGRTP